MESGESNIKYPVPAETYQSLLKAASAEGLVLFIGAGVNAGKKILWRDLLMKLFDEAMEQAIFGHLSDKDKRTLRTWVFEHRCLNYYEIAELTKFAFGHANNKKLKKFLYSHSINNNEKNKLLEAVAELCTSDVVQAVVTYNFDDYLEKEVISKIPEDQKKNNAWRIIVHFADQTLDLNQATSNGNQTDEQPKASEAVNHPCKRLDFYHVHGFIPLEEHRKFGPNNQVVFSQEEYFLNMLNPHSWQTTTQLHFLRNYNCLFIGASLSDINMSRLLSYSHDIGKRHSRWVIMAEEAIINADLNQGEISPKAVAAALRIKATILSKLGIELVIAGKEYDEIMNVVLRLRKDVIDSRTKS